MSSSWSKLQWIFSCVQDHHFPRAQDVVRHHAEIDLERCTRETECFHDYVSLYSWKRSTLIHDEVIKWTKTKVHVYWDSVLCLGRIYEYPEVHTRCKELSKTQKHISIRSILKKIKISDCGKKKSLLCDSQQKQVKNRWLTFSKFWKRSVGKKKIQRERWKRQDKSGDRSSKEIVEEGPSNVLQDIRS